MQKWFVFLTSAVISAVVYLLEPTLTGLIASGITFVVSIGSAYLLDVLNEKFNITRVVSAMAGMFAALAVLGIANPLFSGFPPYVIWVVLGIFASLGGYGFYLYDKEAGFGFTAFNKPADKNLDAAGGGIAGGVAPKVLDTSIIIDGRIIDIASAGFIEGPMVVPNFVLREIQLISDSPDPIKRNRGRRGLDMLNSLQKRDDLEVKISYKDYEDTREVDAKLVRLAREIGGRLVTNDFNLNKVAELQDVLVLNINNLANALKPVVLPGEEMDIQVVKEGKDENQGIGYLDDGTMVVIENGGKLMGKKARVNVTSVIQTNAGKMIFTKIAGK